MKGIAAEVRAQVRAGRRRGLLAAAGIAAAAALLGTAVTVAYALDTGFDRAARAADLPEVVARFDPEAREDADARLRALPNVEARAYRSEIERVSLAGGSGRSERGVVQAVGEGRRGYAIVAGRDVRGPSDGGVVVERGVARAWDLAPGDELVVGRLGPRRVVGIAVGPDNVAFPLAPDARVYVSAAELERRFAPERLAVNVALVWAADPSRVDVTLQQARATSFGVGDLRFVTREGVQVLLDRAAGVVIALLVAFALVALGAAGVMLGVAAHADVQRRLPALGVQRAIGVGRGRVTAVHAAAAALVALPAAAAGLAAGALVAAGPADALLVTLNGLSPGAALLGPLAVALAATVTLVAAASAWPTWRAAGRPPVALLRGAELATPRARRWRREGHAGRGPGDGSAGVDAEPGRAARTATGPAGLGVRLALARRGRYVGTVAVLATCVAVVALLLALAALLTGLRDDPAALGKRYALTADLPADAVGQVTALPGVAAAAPRYEVQAADSFALGTPVRLVAFPGDHTRFEDPPLAEGRRVRADDEAEVGAGLATALNLGVGGTLAAQLDTGAELRFRIVGIVRALEDEGRIAHVRPARLLAAAPATEPQIAVALEPGADRTAVVRGLRALGARPDEPAGATSTDRGLLSTLAALLRALAGVAALVCLYALVQALTLVALERRPTIAVLRATGAGARTVALLLGGVAAAAVVPAALLGLALQRWVLGPLVGRLAAGYADLAPIAGPREVLAVCAGLATVAAASAAWAAWRALRAPVVEGLVRE